jgi:glycosyltransferase involved in cell wall biosynthesis
MKKFVITFMLPGDNRSGGVRVTAIMGNLLLERGYHVRIVLPKNSFFSLRNFASLISKVKNPFAEQNVTGWLHTFIGTIEKYGNINELEFRQGEIVIAVGSFTLVDLIKINSSNITKVRYNHGFPIIMTDEYMTAMSVPMPTITVSNTLVPELERLTGNKVMAVIPNGIDTSQYFPVSTVKRDSIGTIYSSHPNKAPADIIRLMNRIEEVFPSVNRVVFSTESKPRELNNCHYEQYPNIERVRELYSKSIIWLLASHTEGLPGPVLEAMACGAVVISADNDGSLEVVKDGMNGLIVPKGDIELFIKKIQEVLTDNTLRERLVHGGYDTVSKFTWTAAADLMENFLGSITKS